MNELLLPFAKRRESDEIVGPDEVPRGSACGCVCLFCNEEVVARRGEINREHFAHAQRKEEPCPASFPRAILWMASRIIRESTSLKSPSHTISLWHPYEMRQREYDVAVPKELDYKVSKVTEDAAGRAIFADITVAGRDIGLVATFGQAVTLVPDEWGKDRPQIHINLSFSYGLYSQHKHGFRNVLAEELLGNPVHARWHQHPREAHIRARFSAEIEAETITREQERLERSLWEKARREEQLQAFELRSAQEQERIEWLASLMEKLAERGHKVVDQCQNCFAAQEPGRGQCLVCNHETLVQRPTDKGILDNIRYKFACWGYGSASLAALPSGE